MAERHSTVKSEPTAGSRFVGQSVNAQGNEFALERKEKGRTHKGHRSNRPQGTSGARFVTGVNPLESVTGGPYLPRA